MLGRGLVVAFMILLVLAAVALAAGNEGLANQLAEYAYYTLASGVALLLASTVLTGSEEDDRGGAAG